MYQAEGKLNLPLSNCKECPLYDEVYYTPHNYTGNLNNPKILFIGEAPEGPDKTSGKVFQGDPGKLLRDHLANIGINNYAMYNTVCCRPEIETNRKIKNRKPTTKEKRFCKENLDALIKQVNPEFIVPLGAVPMKAMKVKGGVTVNRATLFETDYGKIIPCFHPGYILRNPGFLQDFIKDLQRIKDITEGTEHKVIEGKYYILKKLSHVNKLKEMLLDADEFAFDTETTGLLAHRDDILGISFSYKEKMGYYIPLIVLEDDWGFAFSNPEELNIEDFFAKEIPGKKKGTTEKLYKAWGLAQNIVLDILREILTSNVAKTAQNGKFDIKMLEYHLDIRVKNFKFDTMLIHYLLDENKPHGLKYIADCYFEDLRGYERELDEYLPKTKKEDKQYGLIPLAILGKYGAVDTDATFRAKRLLYPQLTPALKKYHDNFYMPLSRVYADAETVGVKIDVPYTEKLIIEYEGKIETSYKAIMDCVPWAEGEEHIFNLNSYKQMGVVLYDKLKYPVLKYTDKTYPAPGAKLDPNKTASTDEETLKLLRDKLIEVPIVKHILEYRGDAKMLSTYLKPFLEKRDENDRVHTSYLLHGAVTGRLSSKPNLQNIPRQKDIKGIFIPDDDYYLVEIDYSQVELRVMAWYSKDPIMYKQYLEGEDVHLITACKIFKLTLEEFKALPPEEYKRKRKLAKLVNFGYMFGAYANRVMKSINEKLEEDEPRLCKEDAEQFRADFFNLYKGIEAYIIQQHKDISKDHQITSCFGRIRRLPQMESPYEEKKQEGLREGLNAIIQGTASDLTQLSAIRTHKHNLSNNLKSRFLFSVHDALIFEIHKEELSLVPILKSIMEEQVGDFDMPLIAEEDIYEERWGTDAKQLGDYEK